MAFTLRVVFTGLCAFVENQDPQNLTRMCVVLVNGTRPERERNVQAIDGTPLRFHRAFVTFPIHVIDPPVPDVNGLPMAHGLWYLNRERLLFNIKEEAGAPNNFDVQRPNLGNPHPEVPNNTPQHRESFTWIVDLARVAPQHTVIDPAVVANANVSPNAIAQVLIRRGRLRPFSFTRAIWEFDSHLAQGQAAHRRNFAHEASLTFAGLTEATLVSNPLDLGGVQRSLPLTPPPGVQIVTVKISNLCEVNPLQWFTTREPEPDHDIKWFYEILSDATKTQLRQALNGRRLPIPRPVQFLPGLGGPGSGNCIPVQTAKTPFNFP